MSDTDKFEKVCHAVVKLLGLSDRLSEAQFNAFLDAMRRRAGKSLLPKPSETLVIALDNPKTAALAYDKVWNYPTNEEEVPESVSYYCATEYELIPQAGALLSIAAAKSGMSPTIDVTKQENLSPKDDELVLQFLRHIAAAQAPVCGAYPTLFYATQAAHDEEFGLGPREVLVASLGNLGVVEEAHLQWEQIVEFRRDRESRAKYRRLVHWLDAELKDKSPSELIDLLGTRLEDYEWSLKKHGVKSVTGSISAVVDPKFLTAATGTAGALGLAAGGGWGALMGAGLVIGKVGAELKSRLIDGEEERRAANYEIAYVHEVKKRLQSH